MSRIFRIVVLALTLSALLTGTAQAQAAEGVGCTTTKSCTTTTGGALMLTPSVSCTVRFMYSFTSQKPASLTWLKKTEPAPIALRP